MLPELKHYEGSWILIHKPTGRICEIFKTDSEDAETLIFTGEWEAISILEYLSKQ